MQKWEYKTIFRTRAVGAGAHADQYMPATVWNLYPDGMEVVLAELGSQGWELVTVIPGSSWGSVTRNGNAPLVNGVTSEQYWIFKRPSE